MSSKYTYQDLEADYINNRLEAWITSNSLLNISQHEQNFSKRYVFNQLISFLNTKSNTICAICGLRRIGKSVLMRQAIYELIKSGVEPSRIAYITFGKNTEYTDTDLISKIRTLSNQVDYFFIDEMSYVKFDVENNSLNLLSDEFAVQGKKIVITGTFSYILRLLSNDVLFDRMDKIDTTYFSFKEAHEVLGVTIEDFIVYGGIIAPNERLIPEEYMKSAITSNIINSLIRSEKIYEIGCLNKDIDDVIEDERRLKLKLGILIRRVMDNYMKFLIYAKILNANYKFSDVGNLADLIRQRSQRDSQLELVINIDKKKYNRIIENYTGSINTQDISKKCFDQLLSLFKQIGIIEDLFLQHSYESCFITPYLKYGLCEEICHQIDRDIQKETNGLYSANLALDNLRGSILECVIYLDFLHSNKYNFDKYRNNETGYEVDLLITTEEGIHLYEIKYSEFDLIEHTRNIVNNDFILELEHIYSKKVTSYNIIYRGITLTKEVNPEEVFQILVDSSIRENAKEKWMRLRDRAKQFSWSTIQINYINAAEFLCMIQASLKSRACLWVKVAKSGDVCYTYGMGA